MTKQRIQIGIGILTLIVGGCLYAGMLKDETVAQDASIGGVTESLLKEVDTIKTEQDALYTKYGEYVQVKDGVSLTKDGAVSEPTLTSKTFTTIEVNVYDGPYGKGYQTVTKTATATVYTGYGPEAKAMTYTVPIPAVVASSTKR